MGHLDHQGKEEKLEVTPFFSEFLGIYSEIAFLPDYSPINF
jgi:hypothetical protein